jgi:hypothetical protein
MNVRPSGPLNVCEWQFKFRRWTASGTTTDLGQWDDQRSCWTTASIKYAQFISHTWPSKSTIHSHLTALGKIYKSCRVVPHELTAEQAQRRVEFCRKLFQLPKDHRFIKRIATCDEKWIYLNNPDLQKQWLHKGQLTVPVAKRQRFGKKRSSFASGGTTKVLFIMNLCQTAVRSTQRYIPNNQREWSRFCSKISQR